MNIYRYSTKHKGQNYNSYAAVSCDQERYIIAFSMADAINGINGNLNANMEVQNIGLVCENPIDTTRGCAKGE